MLLAASVLPYTRLTIELAEFAARRSVRVVALTDSEVSPLAQLADHLVIVPTSSPAFLDTLAPAFVATEILGALVAGHAGHGAVEALRRFDEQGVALGTHLFHRTPRLRQRETQ